MLLYAETDPTFAGYNQRYAANPELFKVSTAHLRFVEAFMAGVAATRPRPEVLEVGCGQGYLLSHIRQAIPDVSLSGVDGSDVAIRQAAEREPEITWVADDIRPFLAAHDERVGDRRYDVILDRTGTTFIRSQNEAETVQAQLHDLLTDHGAVVYLASRSFYDEKLAPATYADWSTDWLGLLRERFSRTIDLSDAGSYLMVFAR